MTTRDELIVKFTAETAEFNRRISEVENKVSKFSQKTQQQTDSISKSFKNVGTAAAAYLSITAIASFTHSVVDLASRLNDLSKRTGIALDPLQRLNSLASQTGVSIDLIASSTQQLGRRLADNGKDVKTALEYIGVGFEDIKKAAPDQQLLMISRAFENVKDNGVRAKLATDLFGLSGLELLQVFAEGSGNIEKIFKDAAVASDDIIQKLDDFGDKWAKEMLDAKTAAAGVLSVMLDILDTVQEFQKKHFNIGMLITGEDNANSIQTSINNAKYSLQGNNLSEQKRKELEAYVRIMEKSQSGVTTTSKGVKVYGSASDVLPAAPAKKLGEYKSATEVAELEKTNKAYEDRAEAINRSSDATYDLSAGIKEIIELENKGFLTHQQAITAVDKLNEGYEKLNHTLADDLTDALNSPIQSFDDLKNVALDVLKKIAIQAIITSLQLDKVVTGTKSGGGSLIGTIGKGIGSFIGGFFADGGEPPLNKPSVVGERGAELFVPKVAGNIIPNKDLGGSAGSSFQIIQNLNLSTGVVDTVRVEVLRMLPLIAKNTQESILAANKRGGAMSITMNNRS